MLDKPTKLMIRDRILNLVKQAMLLIVGLQQLALDLLEIEVE